MAVALAALDADAECIPAMVGNLRAAALTGAAYDHSIVIAQQDVRGLTPDDIERSADAIVRDPVTATRLITACRGA